MTTQALIKFITLCVLLGTTRNGVRNIAARDPSFPKPLKFGTSKQAPVFYDAAEIADWLELKKSERIQPAANDNEGVRK
jgi:predicted DNA-binding transcriptional regulator AlpA